VPLALWVLSWELQLEAQGWLLALKPLARRLGRALWVWLELEPELVGWLRPVQAELQLKLQVLGQRVVVVSQTELEPEQMM